MKHIGFKEILKDYLDNNTISNKEFASRIGITPKHLIDILSGKSELTLPVIESISIVTNIPMNNIIEIEKNYHMEENINSFLKNNNITLPQYLNKFSYKNIKDKKWINFVYEDNKIDILMDILKYLRVKDPDRLYSIDKNIMYKSKNDKPELLMLWLERCYRISQEQEVKEYKKENINDIVKYILDSANKNIFNEKELINTFNNYGIKLVIEDDLKGSKIRGAFKVNKNTPVIYLTHKHKRIADIYYALLHELAHCKSNFNEARASNIVSYNDIGNEEKADTTALNWMVDEKYYQEILSNSNYDINKENKYPKSFVLYRLALDKKIDYSSLEYQKYNFILQKS